MLIIILALDDKLLASPNFTFLCPPASQEAVKTSITTFIPHRAVSEG